MIDHDYTAKSSCDEDELHWSTYFMTDEKKVGIFANYITVKTATEKQRSHELEDRIH